MRKRKLQHLFWSMLVLMALMFTTIPQAWAYDETVISAATVEQAFESVNAQSSILFDREHQLIPNKFDRVTDLKVTTNNTERSITATGKLDGALFLLKIPFNWNHQVVLYAHGYANPGTQDFNAPWAVGDNIKAVLNTAFGQGFAYGYSAYSKDGYAVENGVKNTQSLKKLVDRIGNHRAYIIGDSMGGNVVMALIEKYEDDYVGALPFCGVVSGWYEQVRYLADFRMVYDFYTLNTPFQLKAFDGTLGDPRKPVLPQEAVTQVATLFGAAAYPDPSVYIPAQYIIQQVSVAAGITPEPVSFITALMGATTGFADLIQTAGGIGYSNTKATYAGGPNLFGVPINSGIYQLAVDNPKAVTYLNNWYTPKGDFEAKVLSVHNTVDPLVPYSHELTLKAKVQAQHNSSRFVVQNVDPGAFSFNPYVDPNTWSPKHCDFKPSQMVFAWNELKNWVEKGVKPKEMNITTK
ncbi:MAG: hypothetical protein HXX08_18980 [Chloroflexi bacterium]|uniref:Serine aminopeptidase S33 domain-containing protein n=1 Tax=Candidatus Chlorohelix allophototropha TaxID=3003348 RepID=A0A8T7M7F7_9CHLR|nr:hypothetical protein [Chloroflexota bacterium]WJW69848.1 hypothetical protein OZ401_003478 [Chloroflexota bacterium L227-S17]